MTPSRCRSCNAPIVWAVTATGKPMPVDAEPTATGSLTLKQRKWLAASVPPLVQARGERDLFDGELPGYTSHFATCAQAAQWRKR